MVRILRVDVVGVSQGSRFTCRARNYQDLLCGEEASPFSSLGAQPKNREEP